MCCLSVAAVECANIPGYKTKRSSKVDTLSILRSQTLPRGPNVNDFLACMMKRLIVGLGSVHQADWLGVPLN